ncbi:glycosyltransferase family 4 protein [Sphingobium sp. AM]|uniref:glycosyltransferase family 4 protein n=1 Tax=Sphingobium sp. AM TaxID=1176302 RepID=UPI0013051979|nr:glycosyltransferase family 1 protein [Sphingobium sp. AM]
MAIDGYNLALKHGTGIARYGRNLLQAIRNIGYETGVIYGQNIDWRLDDKMTAIAFQDHERPFSKKKTKLIFESLKMFFNPRYKTIEINLNNDKNHKNNFQPDFIWNIENLYIYSSFIFRHTRKFTEIDIPGIDIMHWTYPIPVRLKSAKNIYTIHDMIPLKFPKFTLDKKDYLYDLMKVISLESDKIVTVSETSKKDILEILDIKRDDHVFNTYQNFHDNKTSPETSKKIINNIFNLEYKSYFLFYGSWEPKKNIGAMIRAYMLSGTETPLIIVGGDGWGDDNERELFDFLPETSKQNVHRYKYVPDDVLEALVVGAKILIFPSLYEGFGLPVLEAMSAGTAVITSNRGSIPEVTGNACVLVDPHDVDGLSRAVAQLDHDIELRLRLEKAGLRQASLFSTAQYERRLADLYSGL